MKTALLHTAHVKYEDAPAPVLERLLRVVGPLSERIGPGDTVLLKPNFVAPFPLATTDFRILGCCVEAVRATGATPVIGESSGFEFDTQRTIEILGLPAFLEKHGVEFLDFEQGEFADLDLGAPLPSVKVARIAREAKLIINLPVLKGHTITKMTGATKNLFGLLRKSCRRRLHCRHLDRAIAAIARSFPDTIHIVDARNLLTRAVFGESRPLDFLLAGDDPFALDHFGARLLGIDPDGVAHIRPLAGYSIEGPSGAQEGALSAKDSLRERMHRALYCAFYWADELKCRCLGGGSILPWLHWTLGVHPELTRATDEDLKELERLCPIGAVDAKRRRILRDRCMQARCLKCYRDGPPGAVRLGGLNPPRRGKR